MNNFSLLGKGGEKNDCFFSLPDRAIGIGTDPTKCSIVYAKGNNGISAFHCQLVPKQGGWVLTDYSEKGTWLNGKKIKPFQAYPLKVGDVFYLASLENSFYFAVDNAANVNQPQAQNPQWPPQNQPQAQSKWLEIKQKFFSWEGRLNRKPYFQRWLIIFVLQIILNNVSYQFLARPGYLIEPNMSSKEEILLAYFGVVPVVMLIALPLTVSCYMLIIRRLHDLNKSGWWSAIFAAFGIFCFYVSYLTIEAAANNSLDSNKTIGLLLLAVLLLFVICCIFSLYLFFKKGTNGPNRYGSDPLI